MLYTRRGDDGTSSLFGTKQRWPKHHPVFEALGALDELNSLLGLIGAIGKRRRGRSAAALRCQLLGIQETLFIIQAELAGAEKTVAAGRLAELEAIVDRIERAVGNPRAFVIAGASELSAWLDYARAVARRAERRVLAAAKVRRLALVSRQYLNRLSSLLYALARQAAGARERRPRYR